MEVTQNPTLGAVASFLRKENLTMEISYGSGGFCVLLKMKGGMQAFGYAWDVQHAFDTAVESFREQQAASIATEEDTKPGGGYRIKVNTISPERKQK